MKHITTAIVALLALCGCAAVGRTDLLTVDLNRKATPYKWSWTELTDNSVRVSVMRDGEEFSTTGWTGALFVGNGTRGRTFSGTASGYNQIVFDLPRAQLPTNGVYASQIVCTGAGGRTEEWGRGTITVNLNPSVDALPDSWNVYTVDFGRALSYTNNIVALTNTLNAVGYGGGGGGDYLTKYGYSGEMGTGAFLGDPSSGNGIGWAGGWYLLRGGETGGWMPEYKLARMSDFGGFVKNINATATNLTVRGSWNKPSLAVEGAMSVGSSSFANNDGFAAGSSCFATNNYAVALGANANAKHYASFVWNGPYWEDYASHGDYTFSINPQGGLGGIYVGESTLSDLVGVEVANRIDTSLIDASKIRIKDTENASNVYTFGCEEHNGWPFITKEGTTRRVYFPSTTGSAYLATESYVANYLNNNSGYSARAGTSYVALNQSVQTITLNGTPLQITAFPQAPSNGSVRDFILYVNNTSETTACEIVLPAGTYYGDADSTNALPKAAVSMLMFTEISNGVFCIGRKELTQIVVGGSN